MTAGEAPVASSFTLTSSSGLSIDIPVRVTPTTLAATFSNPTPAINEPVTVTAEGYTFLPNAAITIGGAPALILNNDGTTVSFLPVPGTTGPATIDNIAVNFLPTTPLSLETTTEVTTPALTGKEAPATAPEIPVPAAGASTLLYDGGPFTAPDITPDGGAGAQYYKFVVTDAGDYNFVTNWVGEADFDPVVCADVACASAQFAGTGLDHPENGTADAGRRHILPRRRALRRGGRAFHGDDQPLAQQGQTTADSKNEPPPTGGGSFFRRIRCQETSTSC